MSEQYTPALPCQGSTAKSPAVPSTAACPPWKVSGIFSSHMVLQRNAPITVWGRCAHPGAAVTGSWDGETVTGTVDENCRWALTFAPRQASYTPTEMTVASEWSADTFTDILVGDVWVLGGQSNMELNLAPCLHTTPDIAESFSGKEPFRLFTQTQVAAMACKKHHHTPAPDIIRRAWHWQRPTEAAAKKFSAVGYYFAKLVAPRIDAPLGLVMMCAGGACLRELMPPELAARLGYTTGANVPVSGYYHTLIAPLLGLQFRGQLFFQGESEGIWKEMALSYDTDLAAFVEDERQRFGVDFSFYNVQLSDYRAEGPQYFPHLHWVRSRQLRAVNLIPNSYMAVDRDLGSPEGYGDFAHSPYKFELARRLAAQVLANDYGIGDAAAAESPTPCAVTWGDGFADVQFAYTNGPLTTADPAAVRGFAVPSADGEGVPCPAAITGSDTVRVTLPAGEQPAALYYAMTNQADLTRADLCGGSGLPVPAFVWE